jgi:hypothetical protein
MTIQTSFPPIKFSKNYKKLPENANGRLAILKLATRILLQHQEAWFIAYDISARDDSVYSLPRKGEYILLVFELSEGGIFTTLRRHTIPKYQYYKRMQDSFFRVVIEEASRGEQACGMPSAVNPQEPIRRKGEITEVESRKLKANREPLSSSPRNPESFCKWCKGKERHKSGTPCKMEKYVRVFRVAPKYKTQVEKMFK